MTPDPNLFYLMDPSANCKVGETINYREGIRVKLNQELTMEEYLKFYPNFEGKIRPTGNFS